jgi:hypothetical protein
MAMDRRGFLGTLAIAPAALSACASGRAAAKAQAPRGEPAPSAPPPQIPEPLAAVRAFALPPSAGPAYTFRASVLPYGEP